MDWYSWSYNCSQRERPSSSYTRYSTTWLLEHTLDRSSKYYSKHPKRRNSSAWVYMSRQSQITIHQHIQLPNDITIQVLIFSNWNPRPLPSSSQRQNSCSSRPSSPSLFYSNRCPHKGLCSWLDSNDRRLPTSITFHHYSIYINFA